MMDECWDGMMLNGDGIVNDEEEEVVVGRG